MQLGLGRSVLFKVGSRGGNTPFSQSCFQAKFYMMISPSSEGVINNPVPKKRIWETSAFECNNFRVKILNTQKVRGQNISWLLTKKLLFLSDFVTP